MLPARRCDRRDDVQNETQWERHARWWQHEFTDGVDPEYEEQVLPLVGRRLEGATRVLDVGCGEGQVARRVARSGAEVVGIDPAWSQVRTARERGAGPRFARARAEALPFRTDGFDAVLVCAALEHVDDFEIALAEVARVLEPGGRFVLVLCHPLLQAPGSGWIDDRILGEQYWRIGTYLRDDRRFAEAAPGVELLFNHRPLSRYVHAMGAVGLLIDDMEEPAPPPGLVPGTTEYADVSTIPRVMVVQARAVG
jgi:SAM-dependent methyltransferase